MFLLDTNIVSELVKRVPNPTVVDRLHSQNPSSLLIGAVTVFELRFGAARSVKPASLWSSIQRLILDRFKVLPFTPEDALFSADLLAPLAAQGNALALQDLWLAGTAYRHNLTLVTRNRRDFDRVRGLKIENWFD
jgi:tRNA(fMet)-specific endonuclease VapC